MSTGSAAGLARVLRLEAGAAEVQTLFNSAGMRSLLIKGPVTSRWLYDNPRDRSYLDLDVLVDPARFDEARGLLVGAGFEDEMAGVRNSEVAPHARDFRRGELMLDLHRQVPGVGVPAAEAFEVFWAHRVALPLGGGAVTVGDEDLRCLLLALTVVSAVGGTTQPSVDLERALDRVSDAAWSEAAVIARAVDAEQPFVAGLRSCPSGDRLADALGIPQVSAREPTPVGLMEAQLKRLRQLPTVRAQVAMVLGELVPSRAFLRYSTPLARRGRLGLAAAYATRPALLGWRAGRILWRQMRR